MSIYDLEQLSDEDRFELPTEEETEEFMARIAEALKDWEIVE